MADFYTREPTVEDCWRGIILYGKNSATFKFALATALLELRPQSGQLVKLEDLAASYGLAIAKHLKTAPKQGTNPGKFLRSVASYNQDQNLDALTKSTVALGFENVIDAFHNIDSSSVAHKFFTDERKLNKGIRITDEFAKLVAGNQSSNIGQEVDSRWRLVETAWGLNIAPRHLVLRHDHDLGEIFTFDRESRRQSVTSSRGALNGYQHGKCFYCFADLQLIGEDFNTDVDHFFPHKYKHERNDLNLDGVWNLVLSCAHCNRGPGGKFDRIPSLRLLQRLHMRNEYLIMSRHPLRETLINQTGANEAVRRSFLSDVYNKFQLVPQTPWEAEETGPNSFAHPLDLVTAY